jgi:hypothetical protein
MSGPGLAGVSTKDWRENRGGGVVTGRLKDWAGQEKKEDKDGGKAKKIRTL